MSEHIQGVTASPPGSRPSDGAASTGVSTVPASIPNAGLLERLRCRYRRHELETGGATVSSDGKVTMWTNGEVWQDRNPDGGEAARVIERLWSAMRGGNADSDNAKLMEFVADRLVNVHGERSGTDYILALRTRAAMIRAAASGIEARRVETGTGSVHESPVGDSRDAP